MAKPRLLTPVQVKEIRRTHGTISDHCVARLLGVDRKTVWQIRAGVTYKEIPMKGSEPCRP